VSSGWLISNVVDVTLQDETEATVGLLMTRKRKKRTKRKKR